MGAQIPAVPEKGDFSHEKGEKEAAWSSLQAASKSNVIINTLLIKSPSFGDMRGT
jgi:hypothetical protein